MRGVEEECGKGQRGRVHACECPEGPAGRGGWRGGLEARPEGPPCQAVELGFILQATRSHRRYETGE